MKTKIFCITIVLATLSLLKSHAQDDPVWNIILSEEFNNNNNGWLIFNSELRKSSINSGFLSDWYGEAGCGSANLITVDFDTQKDYFIKFSIANNYENSNQSYRIFEKKQNGTLKETWSNNSIWGFIWGFKDWSNYNSIIFYHKKLNSGYSNAIESHESYIKLLTVENGKETTVMDWQKCEYWGNQSIKVYIEKYNTNNFRVFFGSGIVIYSSKNAPFKWYGNGIGPYMEAGANIEVDYIHLYEKKPHENTGYDEASIKAFWEKNGIAEFEGLYENTTRTDDSPKYRLAIKKATNGYKIIYLDGGDNSIWKMGDVKAYLSETATHALFKVIWFMSDKTPQDNLYIKFNNGSMILLWNDNKEDLYIKLYPSETENINEVRKNVASGTGFAISRTGIIATNYHVIKDAKAIRIRGLNSNFISTHSASVLLVDKINDLALLQIDDFESNSIEAIPFNLKVTQSNVGESVFVLGYPLLATMGDEIKLTNGIISSKTGFMGDVTSYQISAPVQPGNSGGQYLIRKEI